MAGWRPGTAAFMIGRKDHPIVRAKLIACETMGGEFRRLVPEGMPTTFLRFGLHLTPERLHDALQAEIDSTDDQVDTLLFGYGICSRGTLGLEAGRFRLVVPRMDDCIGLFLGSRADYARQHTQAPGTFYLTAGWIECGDDPYSEYLRLCAKYGERKAYWLEKQVIGHYTRLALIDTGSPDMERYRAYARHVADFFDLAFEEIPGSDRLFQKLVAGDWDEDFLVVEPGGRVEFGMFLSLTRAATPVADR